MGVDRHTGDIAWLCIIGTAIAYEFLFEDLLTLSADRCRARYPLLTRFAIIAIAGHLAALLPAWADLFSAKNVAHRGIVYLGERQPRVRFIASPLAIMAVAIVSRKGVNE
jgi:hypothetical protein